MSAAHECIKTMTVPISPSRGSPGQIPTSQCWNPNKLPCPLGQKLTHLSKTSFVKLWSILWKQLQVPYSPYILRDLRNYVSGHLSLQYCPGIKKTKCWLEAGWCHGNKLITRNQFSFVRLTQDILPDASQFAIKHLESTVQHQSGWAVTPSCPKRHQIFI